MLIGSVLRLRAEVAVRPIECAPLTFRKISRTLFDVTSFIAPHFRLVRFDVQGRFARYVKRGFALN